MRNKTQKSIISIFVVLALVISCFASVPMISAASPVQGNPSPLMNWKTEYTDKAQTITPYNYDRGSANGDKIPSNAHSADFPGIYFYWNNKQADNGVLLVAPFVFDLFVDRTFTVTAKTSNCYWGHTLSADDTFAIDEASGLYIYNVFKNCMYKDKKGNLLKDDMKNINMIFIDGTYKDAKFEITKNWFDEEGNPITDRATLDAQLKLNGGKLGENIAKITDYKTAYFGKTISVTETIPTGWFEQNNKASQKITVKHNDDPLQVITFNNQKKWAQIEIVKIWQDVDGITITNSERITELEAKMQFTINGENKGKGIHEVKEGTYTISETNWPAGFNPVGDSEVDVTVAAGKTKTVTFTNKEIPPLEIPARIVIEKTVDGIKFNAWAEGYTGNIDALLDGILFKLYKVDEKGANIKDGTFIGDSKLNEIKGKDKGHYIEFTVEGKHLPGWFAVEEVLSSDAASVFKETTPMYIYVGKSGYDSDGTKIVSDNTYGAIVTTNSGDLMNGPFKLPDVWINQLKDDTNYQTMANMGAQWIWASTKNGVDDTHRFGVTGSEVRFDFTVGVDEDTPITIYFAADNAAAIYVNGQLKTYTTEAFAGRVVQPVIDNSEKTTPGSFFNKAFEGFDGGWGTGWCHVYAPEIMLTAGENTITIFAANSARTPDEMMPTNTANDDYDETNNPCGLIFAFNVPGATFDNSVIDAEVSVSKLWINEAGDEIDTPYGITATLTNGWNFNDTKTVTGGTKISFSENQITQVDIDEAKTSSTIEEPWSAWAPTGNREVVDGVERIEMSRTKTTTVTSVTTTTTTSYKLAGVTINGKQSADDVCFIAKGGKAYEIVFTNQVVIKTNTTENTEVKIDRETCWETRELTPTVIDRIESESHVGKWWATGYGVIALAGSSITGHLPGQYAIGISDEGFAKFDGTVYIGYGSSATSLTTIVAFKSDGTWNVIRGEPVTMVTTSKSPNANMHVESNPYKIDEVLEFEWLFIFNNVNGNGAMHAYLLEF